MSVAPFAYRLKKETQKTTWDYNRLIPKLLSLDRKVNRTKDKGMHRPNSYVF